MPFWGQLSFQDSASPGMYSIAQLHDHAMLIVVLILTFVTYMTLTISTATLTRRYVTEARALETAWTILPAVILLFLAIPSIRLLYLLDELVEPQLTMKAIGHQWYWTYEYPELDSLTFDSYMVPNSDLVPGTFRLLEVDHRAILPTQTEMRILVTATDVIHSWAVPSMGLKADAIPGRTNQMTAFLSRPGLYFGQCSEICGVNHTFMPIVVEGIPPAHFLNWAALNTPPPQNLATTWKPWLATLISWGMSLIPR